MSPTLETGFSSSALTVGLLISREPVLTKSYFANVLINIRAFGSDWSNLRR